ncbi:hypothetical protein [Ereboglobus luteus]|uniref:Uncharacterized protein n=1 Tax=Ereboglobus luteus TaxID=1796921 RepID=A0A2U8E069_9BACT|nr:hypothetical protein [Ereboglobus luteus]AWI08175.1 hypothetical protein CKA38_01865 [Ereboglobus luteus]
MEFLSVSTSNPEKFTSEAYDAPMRKNTQTTNPFSHKKAQKFRPAIQRFEAPIGARKISAEVEIIFVPFCG